MLVDCISRLPLYELTTPGNIADSSVAAEILATADQTISLKECAFLADKGYDVKSIYNTVKTVYEGEAFIPLKPRRTKDLKAPAEILLPLPPVQNRRMSLQPQELEQREEKPGLHEI